MSKQLFFSSILFTLLTGCAGLYETQPPAPVFGGPVGGPPPPPPSPAPKQPAESSREPSGIVTTQPLQEPAMSEPESIEYKPEPPLPPETGPEQQPEEQPSATQPPSTPPKIEGAGLGPEPAIPLTPFEPLETSAPLSPAVGALVVAANKNSSSGNLDIASSTIERAIRIEPRNANLYYKLALIRIKQSKPRLAEDLAKKSSLLADTDRTLKKHSWLLIAHARELQGNLKGAQQARTKADSF